MQGVFEQAASVTAWDDLDAAVLKRRIVQVVLDGDDRHLLGLQVGSPRAETVGFLVRDEAFRQVLVPGLG